LLRCRRDDGHFARFSYFFIFSLPFSCCRHRFIFFFAAALLPRLMPLIIYFRHAFIFMLFCITPLLLLFSLTPFSFSGYASSFSGFRLRFAAASLMPRCQSRLRFSPLLDSLRVIFFATLSRRRHFHFSRLLA